MAETKPQPRAQVLSTYIKDLSFENIGAQNRHVPQSQPKFDMNINIAHDNIEGDVFEVSIRLKVKATEGESTIFLIDLDHAGRFALKDVPEDQRVPFLYIECPRLLFPYTRQVVSQTTHNGGLLPLNLDHIDFVQLFQNSVEQARAKQSETN